jgi:hypothetical protein
MRGRRKDSAAWQQVEWTTARAGQLGLLSKDQWKKQPQAMLVARATGEICRLIAADALFAMPYAAEELAESSGRLTRLDRDKAKVTLEEIVGPPQPERVTVERMAAPAAAPKESSLDEFTAIWQQILTAAEHRGWDAERTEREFAEGNNGIQAGASEIGPLQGFLTFLGGAA